MRTLALWAPSLVVAVWAVLALFSIDGPLTTFVARLALAISLGIHVHEELRRSGD